MVYTIRKEETGVPRRKRKGSNSEWAAGDLFLTISSNKLKAESLLDDYKNLDLEAIIRSPGANLMIPEITVDPVHNRLLVYQRLDAMKTVLEPVGLKILTPNHP